MSGRLLSRLERLIAPEDPGFAPHRGAAELVWADLPDEDALFALLGPSFDLGFAAHLRTKGRTPRIRPLLVALSARAAGAGRVDPDLQATAELLHLALAVHDLTLGPGGGRRRAVARKVLNRSLAAFQGSHLTLRALEIARGASSRQALGDVLDTLREFNDGQLLAEQLRDGSAPTAADWLEHADSHTGALYRFCCRVGATVAEADGLVVSSLTRYGRHLGRMWHVAEDLAALHRDQGGVHVLERARTGRPMLPLALAVEIDPSIADSWSRIVARPREDAATALAERIVAVGGAARARASIAREGWSARQALRGVPESAWREALDRIAADLVRVGA